METLRREVTPIAMRNYGRILQDVVEYACTIENELEQKAMIVYVAQCMRQKNLIWNRDQETGYARVKSDIVKLSGGRLNCDFVEFDEMVRRTPSQPNYQKKKKK